MKVLIVDDSLLAEHALKSYFEKLGHEVVGLAKTGEQGKSLFRDHKPDLVTVDAVMPGISGQEYIRHLNQIENEMDFTPKILMISSDEISEKDRKELRVDRYLLKPITLQKIKETLDEI